MSEKPNDRRNVDLALAMILRNLEGETNPVKRLGFEMVYRQTLKDFGRTDEAVRAYLRDHADEVQAAVENKVPR